MQTDLFQEMISFTVYVCGKKGGVLTYVSVRVCMEGYRVQQTSPAAPATDGLEWL